VERNLVQTGGDRHADRSKEFNDAPSRVQTCDKSPKRVDSQSRDPGSWRICARVCELTTPMSDHDALDDSFGSSDDEMDAHASAGSRGGKSASKSGSRRSSAGGGAGGAPAGSRGDAVGSLAVRSSRVIARPSRFYDQEYALGRETLVVKGSMTPLSARLGRHAVRVESATAAITASAIAKAGLVAGPVGGGAGAGTLPEAATSPTGGGGSADGATGSSGAVAQAGGPAPVPAAPVQLDWTAFLPQQYQRQVRSMTLTVAMSDWHAVPWGGLAVNDLDASGHFPVCAVCLLGGRLLTCET
jgi:hypothetical protein